MAKKNRITSDALLIEVPNWEEADRLLQQIGRLQNEIAVAEMACAEQIDSAKLKLQQETSRQSEKIGLYVKSLEAFCDANRKAFGKRQSRKLQFGTVGYRRSESILVKKTTLEKLKAIYGVGYLQYANIKETPNKETLAGLQDAELAGVDARREIKETFFVEPEKTECVHVRDDGIEQG